MFKKEFKYYKSRKPPPNFDSVINFNHVQDNKVISLCLKDNPRNFFGMIPLREWAVYEIIDRPGVLFVKNPFTTIGQRYWMTRCLKDYSRKPNVTNLDIHNIIPRGIDWWSYCQNNLHTSALRKLRWVTLGYHHNWDTKVYSEDLKSDFPSDLSLLCNYISDVLGFKYFKSEAAIVNYYHMDSTLSGHTDHSEHNLDAPLFSLSFGQSAIFLIGGKTIDDQPTALFLHSGDIIIMSREARLAYHGVPRIVHSDDANWNVFAGTYEDEEENGNFDYIDKENLNICCDKGLWRPFGQYLTQSRININVRQVLNEGQFTLR